MGIDYHEKEEVKQIKIEQGTPCNFHSSIDMYCLNTLQKPFHLRSKQRNLAPAPPIAKQAVVKSPIVQQNTFLAQLLRGKHALIVSLFLDGGGGGGGGGVRADNDDLNIFGHIFLIFFPPNFCGLINGSTWNSR